MWDKFKTWAARPFSVDMDATHWFLFIGLLLVVLTAWGLILNEVRARTET